MLTIDEYSEFIERKIVSIPYPEIAQNLYTPIKYTLEGGGKRLRPLLLLASADAFGAKYEEYANQALGYEMFHNFTLLHDDVMDNADVRRGRPTVHRRWNASTAILSGDAMLTMATSLIADCPTEIMPGIVSLFNKTAMEIYQGQQLDMDFESRDDVSIEEYLEMIRLKTSVLLAAACATGAICARADAAAVKSMYDFGEKLGLAFQLQDDYLDTYGDPAIFGKEIGGDIINEKRTWLWINAMTERKDDMQRILDKKLTDYLKIEQVRNIYDELQLPQRSHQLAETYTNQAIQALSDTHISTEGRMFFEKIAMRAIGRKH